MPFRFFFCHLRLPRETFCWVFIFLSTSVLHFIHSCTHSHLGSAPPVSWLYQGLCDTRARGHGCSSFIYPGFRGDLRLLLPHFHFGYPLSFEEVVWQNTHLLFCWELDNMINITLRTGNGDKQLSRLSPKSASHHPVELFLDEWLSPKPHWDWDLGKSVHQEIAPANCFYIFIFWTDQTSEIQHVAWDLEVKTFNKDDKSWLEILLISKWSCSPRSVHPSDCLLTSLL